MPSFDVVSKIDKHELQNAVDQANREVTTRFDFKGTDSKYEFKGSDITMHAPALFQLKQMQDILDVKLTKRGIEVGHLDYQEPLEQNLRAEQKVNVKEGLEKDIAKKLVKSLKDSKLKIQSQIQGDELRVTGKKRDDLQQAMQVLKDADSSVPLQFVNFRD